MTATAKGMARKMEERMFGIMECDGLVLGVYRARERFLDARASV